ncbi:MAG TPA: cyclic nucleotide-binding domain-containing protein, partial [Longimicrobiales bacterium]|nr:cyclic nucleotide-binding domain-containing protein [Longimicrobiales bacterium]
MSGRPLGRLYRDGECILYEGDPSESLFVVQEGRVEIACDEPEGTVRLAVLQAGDLFGEAALF